MKYSKILLTGGTGQVGYELLTTLKPLGAVWAPRRDEFDLANPESLRTKIQAYRPDLIVDPAAYTAVDQAESEPDLAQIINADATRVLAEEAHKLNIPLIYYSTDYVFDGTKTEPYTEDDAPNPLNVYGQTKLEGERAVQAAHDQYLILRTSWVYSPARVKNFYRTMLRLFSEKKEISVVDDQFGAPTSAQFLAEKTARILSQLKKKEASESQWGLYHLTESETMSWYGFAQKILEQSERRASELKVKSILPISSRDFKTVAKRPLNSQLSCSKICQVFEL